MVEDDGAYGFFGAVLADDVVVHALLQVAGVELRHAEVGLGEDGSAPGIKRRIVAARETRAKVPGSVRGRVVNGGEASSAGRRVWRAPGRCRRRCRRGRQRRELERTRSRQSLARHHGFGDKKELRSRPVQGPAHSPVPTEVVEEYEIMLDKARRPVMTVQGRSPMTYLHWVPRPAGLASRATPTSPSPSPGR